MNLCYSRISEPFDRPAEACEPEQHVHEVIWVARWAGPAVAVGGQRMHHPGQPGKADQVVNEAALVGERLARIGERHANPSGRSRARMESPRPCPMTASAKSSAQASGAALGAAGPSRTLRLTVSQTRRRFSTASDATNASRSRAPSGVLA